jgi:hypothetical protein
MKVSELITKLAPFAKADANDELDVLIVVNPNDQFAGVMPVKPDTVKIWPINQGYVLIFKDPNK